MFVLSPDRLSTSCRPFHSNSCASFLGFSACNSILPCELQAFIENSVQVFNLVVCVVMSLVTLPCSLKYWRELTLAAGPHISIVKIEGFATHQKSVRDFKIPRFRLRFLDFHWDFKISCKISRFLVNSVSS